jgi:hypothetical protein
MPTTELKDALTAYEIAAATWRKEQDRLIATWRDLLHNAEVETTVNHSLIHEVLDSMDQFLNRSKRIG